MPKKNYVSITVRRSIYDRFYAKYEEQKEDLLDQGINSFTAWFVSLASKGLD